MEYSFEEPCLVLLRRRKKAPLRVRAFLLDEVRLRSGLEKVMVTRLYRYRNTSFAVGIIETLESLQQRELTALSSSTNIMQNLDNSEVLRERVITDRMYADAVSAPDFENLTAKLEEMVLGLRTQTMEDITHYGSAEHDIFDHAVGAARVECIAHCIGLLLKRSALLEDNQ